jgi:hypothetical protein
LFSVGHNLGSQTFLLMVAILFMAVIADGAILVLRRFGGGR